MDKEQINKDRVVSFSYKPYDKSACNTIMEIKNYCKKSGISFSFTVLKALKREVEEIKSKNESENNELT